MAVHIGVRFSLIFLLSTFFILFFIFYFGSGPPMDFSRAVAPSINQCATSNNDSNMENSFLFSLLQPDVVVVVVVVVGVVAVL